MHNPDPEILKTLSRRQRRKYIKQFYKTFRTESRTDRKREKWDAFEVAYENGIDPRESIANATSSSIGSVANAASNIMGGKGIGGLFGGGGANAAQGRISPQMMAGGLVLAVLVFLGFKSMK